MLKRNINLIKFYFDKKYINSYFIIFINKKLKIFSFANNRNAFIILTNKLIDNII